MKTLSQQNEEIKSGDATNYLKKVERLESSVNNYAELVIAEIETLKLIHIKINHYDFPDAKKEITALVNRLNHIKSQL